MAVDGRQRGRKGQITRSRVIGEEVFLAAVAVFLLVIVLRLHIRLHTGMAAAGVAALVAGGVWKWLDNRSGRFFLPVALVLAFVLAPYAVFGIVGLYSQSFLVAAGGLAVFGAARWWTRNPAKALLAMILAIVACGGYASVSVLSLQWPSECEETSEAVISRGGVVSDVPGAYAILCEQNGPSLYASYPDLRRIVKIIPFEPPLIEEFEHADAATSLAIQTSTGDLIAPLIYERKLGVYNRANLGRREGAPVNCASTVDTDYAATQGVALTLCRFERELDVLRVVQPEVQGRLAYLVRFPSGLGVNAPLDRAYVTDLFGAAMQEIDLESVTPLRRIRVGYGAAGAAVSHDGLRVFVGRPLRSRVDVFNAVSLDRVGKYQVGFGVSILRTDPQGRYLFTASPTAGTVSIVHLETGRVDGPHFVGRPIRDIAYCPASHRLYISTPCSIRYLDLRLMP